MALFFVSATNIRATVAIDEEELEDDDDEFATAAAGCNLLLPLVEEPHACFAPARQDPSAPARDRELLIAPTESRCVAATAGADGTL